MSKRALMKTLLILTILSVFAVARGAEQPWRWRGGEELKSSNGETVRVYRRFYQDKERAFPLAQLTHLKTKKVSDKSFKHYADEVRSSISKMYRPKALVERRYDNARVLEGFWEKGNRFFRYYVWEHAGERHTSIALFRISYGDKLYVESELFQRTLYLKTSGKVATTSTNLLDLIIGQAYAQGNCSCSAGDYLCLLLCTSGGGSTGGGTGILNGTIDVNTNTNVNVGLDANTNSLFSGFLSEMTVLNTNISAFNTYADQNWDQSNANWQETNNQLAGVNQNWANSNQNWQQTNQVMEQTRQEFANFSSMIDRNWTESNAVLDQRMGEFNQILDQRWGESNAIIEDQMQQANDILKQAMEPKNAFVLAAATGAGAALGATLVNFAVDGVVFGIKKLVELFRPDMNDEEKLAAFQKAIEEYEKVTSAHKQLEDILENLPIMMKMSKELKRTREDVAFNMEDLRVERELKLYEIEDAKQKEGELRADTSNSNRAQCVREAVRHRIGLEDQLKDMDKLIAYLQNNTNIENQFCGDLQNIWRKYLDAEMALAALRRKLALPNMQANFLTFKAKQLEEMRENNRDISSAREGNRLRSQLVDIAKNTRDEAKDAVKDARNSLLSLCRNGMSRIMGYKYSRDDIQRHCGLLTEDAFNLERNANNLGRDPYAMYVERAFPREKSQRHEELKNLLKDELNIIGRVKNFKEWENEIEEAYQRNVANAESQGDFLRPFNADLIRVDERLHAYQMESYLNWFKQITADLESERIQGAGKHEGILDSMRDVCPQVSAGWVIPSSAP